jgi:hypothetical protein
MQFASRIYHNLLLNELLRIHESIIRAQTYFITFVLVFRNLLSYQKKKFELNLFLPQTLSVYLM